VARRRHGARMSQVEKVTAVVAVRITMTPKEADTLRRELLRALETCIGTAVPDLAQLDFPAITELYDGLNAQRLA
jgi:hypothetical protein